MSQGVARHDFWQELNPSRRLDKRYKIIWKSSFAKRTVVAEKSFSERMEKSIKSLGL